MGTSASIKWMDEEDPTAKPVWTYSHYDGYPTPEGAAYVAAATAAHILETLNEDEPGQVASVRALVELVQDFMSSATDLRISRIYEMPPVEANYRYAVLVHRTDGTARLIDPNK